MTGTLSLVEARELEHQRLEFVSFGVCSVELGFERGTGFEVETPTTVVVWSGMVLVSTALDRTERVTVPVGGTGLPSLLTQRVRTVTLAESGDLGLVFDTGDSLAVLRGYAIEYPDGTTLTL